MNERVDIMSDNSRMCKHFEVWYQGVPKMGTDYYSCIPPENHLRSMDKAGYIFKYDGKKITLKQAIELTSYLDNVDSTISNNIKVAKIRCVDTGEVFNKQSEAAKHFGIDPAAVSDSLKTGRRRAGYMFERIEE